MAIYTSDHIGKWYWLRYDNNIVLAEEFSTELTRNVSNKYLIQGDAGVHVMSVNGKTMTSSLISDVLIEIPQSKYNLDSPVPNVVTPPFNPNYKDVLDLIISDLKNPLWRIREKKCRSRIRISSQFALISAAIAQANTVLQKSFVYFNYMSFSKVTVKSNFSDLHLCSRIHLLA